MLLFYLKIIDIPKYNKYLQSKLGRKHKVIGLEVEGLMHNFFSGEVKITMKNNDTKHVKKLRNKSDI